MKLLDKVKNMFTEEVEEEVKVEQVKTSPKVEDPKDTIDAINQIREENKKKEAMKKPIFFTDDDFSDMERYSRPALKKINNKEKIKEEKQIEEKEEIDKKLQDEQVNEQPKIEPYRAKRPYDEVKTPKKFKPTPIISPVYGILDKNYHKEDIIDKGNNYESVDGLSVDSIREKAYGTLEDELENTLFGSNSILFNEESNKEEFFDEVEKETESDLLDALKEDEDSDLEDLENITMDIGKELDSLLSKKEKDIEGNEDDLFNLIDSMYEGDEEDDN